MLRELLLYTHFCTNTPLDACSSIPGPAQWRTAASHAAAVARQGHASSGQGEWEASAAEHAEASTRQPCPPEHSGRGSPPADAPSIAAAVRRRLAALAVPQPAQPGLAAPSRPGRQHMPQAWQGYLAARGYPPHLLQRTSAPPDSPPERDHASQPTAGGGDALPGSAKLQRLLALLEAPVAVASTWQDAPGALQSSPLAAEPSGRAAQEDAAAGSMPEQAQGAEGQPLAAEGAAGGAGPPAQEEAAARRAWLQDQEVDDAEEDGDGDGEGMTGDALLWGGASQAAGAQPDSVPEEPMSWEDNAEDGEDAGAAVAEREAVPKSEQLLLQAGIVGVPNSGKSTLTNALVGQKVRRASPAGGLRPCSAHSHGSARRRTACMITKDVTGAQPSYVGLNSAGGWRWDDVAVDTGHGGCIGCTTVLTQVQLLRRCRRCPQKRTRLRPHGSARSRWARARWRSTTPRVSSAHGAQAAMYGNLRV